MLIYLIGPSGAGKSTIAAGAVLRRPEVRHVDLDAVIRAKDCMLFCHDGSRWDEFWSLAARCLVELNQDFAGTSLIDCGAGCLQTDAALSFFRSEKSVVAFIGSPNVLFDRAKRSKPFWANRTLDAYEASEFSECRKKFYNTAKFKLDVSDYSGQDTVSQILSVLEEIERANVTT